MDLELGLVRCPRCERSLDPICFYKDRSKSSGRKSHCRACSKSACRKWKRANPDKLAAYAAEQRRLRRELRLAKNCLQQFYEADSERLDRQQMIELFGPDCESSGIHLSNRRSSKSVQPELTDIEELEELHRLLSENPEYNLGSEYEFASNVFIFRLLNSLFGWQ